MPEASTPSSVPRGIALMAAGFFMTAVMDVIAKWLVQTVPVPQVVFCRYFVHMLILVVVFNRQLPAVARSGRPGLQLVRSTLLMGATAFFFSGLQFLPVADATAVSFTAPLLITAFSVPLLGERVGPRRWAAVLVGFAGALIVIRPGFGVDLAVLLPLCAALCVALYQIATKVLSSVDGSRTTIFYSAVVGLAVSTFVVPFYWAPLDWLEASLLTVLGTLGAFGHLVVIRAYRYAPASTLAPYMYTALIWVTVGGYLVFGHFPDGWTLAGASLVIGSGLYVFLRERKLAAQVATARTG